MENQYYKVPENPAYDLETIRRILNSDPVNADEIVNPVIERLIENIAAVKGLSTRIVVSDTPPASGPVIWLCSDPNWRPGDNDPLYATALLGDPSGAEDAAVTSEIDHTVYPVLNASVSEEGGQVVATIEES